MTALRSEAINLIEKFPEESLEKVLTVLKNLVKEEDPFWSEENQKHLQKVIDDMNHGRNIIKFTSEEWEKFVN